MGTHRLPQLALLLFLTLGCFAPKLHSAVLVVNFTDAPGTGFFNPTTGAAARGAAQHAANIWGGLIGNSSDVINIDASLRPLTGGVLGSGGATQVHRDFNNASMPNTWFPSALANHVGGVDLTPSLSEIALRLNSGINWYFGTDGNTPSGQYDFVSVVLREMGHGLGFVDTISSDGRYLGGFPGVYERFLELGNGTDLLDLNQSDRAAALISDDLFWNGGSGFFRNGNSAPKVFAPNPYQPGRSIGHLDPVAHPNALMTPSIGPGIAKHSPLDFELGMLADMGWETQRITQAQVPEPSTFVIWGLLSLAGGGVAWRRRKRLSPAS